MQLSGLVGLADVALVHSIDTGPDRLQICDFVVHSEALVLTLFRGPHRVVLFQIGNVGAHILSCGSKLQHVASVPTAYVASWGAHDLDVVRVHRTLKECCFVHLNTVSELTRVGNRPASSDLFLAPNGLNQRAEPRPLVPLPLARSLEVLDHFLVDKLDFLDDLA